jgi:hypothetical protein
MTVYSTKPIQKVLQYSAQSGTQPLMTADLDAFSRQRALAYPKELNRRTQELARRWRIEAADDRAYIERVLNWIRTDFSYTLATDEPGINSADDFLFDDKKGFCQHFSSSFALLMRAAGIPSRIVTGYAGGYKNPYGDYWVLYQKDAHAWNEVWLKNEGWIRVDPTAAVAPENILDTLETGSGSEIYFGERSVFSPLFDYGDFIKSRWNDLITGFNAARQETLFKSIGLEQIQRWQLLVLLITISGLLSYLLFLFMNRAPKAQREPVEVAWQNLLRRLGKIGLEKDSHETALDFSARLDGKYPWSAELKDIGARYSQWRYGKPATDSVYDQSLIAAMADLSKRIRIQQKN